MSEAKKQRRGEMGKSLHLNRVHVQTRVSDTSNSSSMEAYLNRIKNTFRQS